MRFGHVIAAVKGGQIQKPDNCEGCGRATEARELQGHHTDYSKLLEVQWLCPACHWERHPTR